MASATAHVLETQLRFPSGDKSVVSASRTCSGGLTEVFSLVRIAPVPSGAEVSRKKHPRRLVGLGAMAHVKGASVENYLREKNEEREKENRCFGE